MKDAINYRALSYVLGTVIFTVYGQVVLKWQMAKEKTLPDIPLDKLTYLVKLIFSNIWIVSSLASAFLAALCWMAAVSELDLSYAYPFMSLSFIFVLFLSSFIFQEPVTIHKVTGLILIVAGILVSAHSL